jgi:hypothetical protein
MAWAEPEPGLEAFRLDGTPIFQRGYDTGLTESIKPKKPSASVGWM